MAFLVVIVNLATVLAPLNGQAAQKVHAVVTKFADPTVAGFFKMLLKMILKMILNTILKMMMISRMIVRSILNILRL
jgi:hypothetical protein